jgi:predicted AAA+ superfamily ATPase
LAEDVKRRFREELGCKNLTVITWDYEEEGEIEYIPLWKWLLVETYR